jgi:rod shape-determining protein MreC
MEFFLSRYRNLTVLMVVILAQLVLLAWQVKNNQDVRLIRVWAVTAVSPLARVVEEVRSRTAGAAADYFFLVGARSENQRLKAELDRLKLENQYLKTELQTADRVAALAQFQKSSPSRTLAARVIGTATGANSKVVFVDRGSTSGVMKGMAVITPDGIVGKVVASFPTASQVMLVTDPTFAAGVVGQKSRVHGTLKGQGHSTCEVDYVPVEEKVEAGEFFYTSGDDRIFPKGLPVGQAKVVRDGSSFKQIFVTPSAFSAGLEEVLIVVEGVHQQVPEPAQAKSSSEVQLLPPPPATTEPVAPAAPESGPVTDADRIRQQYKKLGEAQGITNFGDPGGGRVPNFNLDPKTIPPKTAPPPAVTPVPLPAKPPAQP